MTDYYDLITPRPEPYAHQIRIINGLIPTFKEEKCAALFMDVGTCKTKTILDAAAILHVLGDIDSLLVVPPKSLNTSGTWRDQLEAHAAFPYSVITWDAQKSTTLKWAKQFYEVLQFEGVRIFIVNVEAFSHTNKKLSDCIEAWTATHKTLGIVDESTSIKSSDSYRGVSIGGGIYRKKKITGLNSKLKYRAIMTGTEFTTSPLDVYQQFEYLRPGFFGFKSSFLFKCHYAMLELKIQAAAKPYLEELGYKAKYINGTFDFDESDYIKKQNVIRMLQSKGFAFLDTIGYQNMKELQAKMAPVTFRAKKEECLDLPDTIDEILYVDLSPEQVRVYTDLKKSMMTTLESGELITVEQKMTLFGKFRQIVGGTLIVEGNAQAFKDNPKLDMLVQELSDNEGQAIIWASFRQEITAICERLEKEFGFGCTARYDGDTDDPEKEKNRFLNKTARFFVANPKKGGQGLNLQYNTSVQYWYSFPVELEQWLQARGRTYRAGQTQKCVYRMLVSRFPEGAKNRDTVDARVLSILTQKGEILSQFQSGGLSDLVKLV